MRKPALKKLFFIYSVALVTQLMAIHNHYFNSNYMPNPFIKADFNAVEDVQADEIIPEPKSEKQEIIEYIVEVFKEDAPDAFMVLSCENKGLRPDAVNHNRNGSIDEGIFQVNSIHGQEDMQNWRKNIDYAYKIFSRQGWSPWSCSHKVGVTPFYLK